MLVLAFESADHPLEPWMKRALECCADHEGKIPADAAKTRTDAEATHEGSAGAGGQSFLNAADLMETGGALGGGGATFGTPVTLGRVPDISRPIVGSPR